MKADYFTKPVQDQKFTNFCTKIMNLKSKTPPLLVPIIPNKSPQSIKKTYASRAKSVGQQECVGASSKQDLKLTQLESHQSGNQN